MYVPSALNGCFHRINYFVVSDTGLIELSMGGPYNETLPFTFSAHSYLGITARAQVSVRWHRYYLSIPVIAWLLRHASIGLGLKTAKHITIDLHFSLHGGIIRPFAFFIT